MSGLRDRTYAVACQMAESDGKPMPDPADYAHIPNDAPPAAPEPPAARQPERLPPRPAPLVPLDGLLDEPTRQIVQTAIDTAAHMTSLELAAQQLRFAATGLLIDPADVERHLRAEDFVGTDGRPDQQRIRDAVARLAGEHPHLAIPQAPRAAAPDAGQGGSDSTPLAPAVQTVLAQMAEPSPWR